MISRDLTITVNNNSATLSEPVTLYRGDRGIQLNCKIMQYKFKFNRSSLENVINYSSGLIYARVLVHKPTGEGCFEVPIAEVDNDTVVITITRHWLDEIDELGTYKLQIQLYGEDYVNERVTIPAVEFKVEDVLCDIEEKFTPYSDVVGVAVADLLMINEVGEEYNSDYSTGVYNATKWGPGDIVTANALNKMEDAIDYSISELVQKADRSYVDSNMARKTDISDFITSNEVSTKLAVQEAETAQELDKKADVNHTHSDMVTSSTINRIEFVTSYPTTMEPDVLYILISGN